jgi:hypothetical protein
VVLGSPLAAAAAVARPPRHHLARIAIAGFGQEPGRAVAAQSRHGTAMPANDHRAAGPAHVCETRGCSHGIILTHPPVPQAPAARRARASQRRPLPRPSIVRTDRIPEIAASAGLVAGLAVAPLGAAAAGGLVLLMAGAIRFRVRAHDSLPFLLGDAAFLLLAAATVVLRIASI